MNAPAPSVHALRACELCSHSRAQGTQLLCTHPMVSGALRQVPCALARYGEMDQAGGCGRDARHLHWPALEVPVRAMPRELWAATA